MLNFQYIYFLAAFACFIQVADSIDKNKVDQSLTCDGKKLSISCLDVAPIGQKCFIRNISMGRTCYSPDENNQVKIRCQGHGSCNIPAEHNVAGDACYGTNKTMKVYCTCYKAEHTLRTLITCEWRRMYIRCPVTERIRIKYASYGRYDNGTCYIKDQMWDKSCFSEDAEFQVKKRCDGHQACYVASSNGVFGDPCVRTHKYLDVKYICEKAEPCTLELCMKNGGTCSDSGCMCEPGVSGKACVRVLPVYIGCFEDRVNRDNRGAMNEQSYSFSSMTVEWCTRWCHYMGHKYAALQAAAVCFCGDGGYDKYGLSKNCNRSCSGNNTEVCGGIWANSVYRVSVFPVYIGCFRDHSSGTRAMNERLQRSNSMTVGLCTQWCRNMGHKYAALQYSVECFCGDGGYDKYGVATNCDRPCYGDNTEICGGSDANSVYRVVEKDEPCTSKICKSNGGTCSDSGGKACLRVLPVYIGCFADSGLRAMKEQFYMSMSITVESCTRWCQSLGYKYAALQDKEYCFCGDGGYDTFGESKKCTRSCEGSNKEICGGSNANSVYSVVAEPCTLELCMKNGGTCSESGCMCEPGLSGKVCVKVLPDYIGCFKERYSRAIDERFYAFGAMSVEWCTRWCHYKGHKYAALQFGNGCYCGDGGYDKYGESKNCTMPCIGDYTQVCGGSMTNSVYNVSGTQPVKP